MTTKFIGMKEFRRQIATCSKQAINQKVRFIILKKNVPILEVKAIDEKDITLEKLTEEIREARDQIKKGKTYTQKEIMKELGLL